MNSVNLDDLFKPKLEFSAVKKGSDVCRVIVNRSLNVLKPKTKNKKTQTFPYEIKHDYITVELVVQTLI